MAGPGFKPFDFISLFLALAAIFAALIPVYGAGKNKNTINLQGEGGAWVFPRDAEETVAIPGPLGDTVVEIRDGRARVLSSPCHNQTCVAAGSIRSHGQWVACLPNRVMISVEGGSGEENPGEGSKVDAAAW